MLCSDGWTGRSLAPGTADGEACTRFRRPAGVRLSDWCIGYRTGVRSRLAWMSAIFRPAWWGWGGVVRRLAGRVGAAATRLPRCARNDSWAGSLWRLAVWGCHHGGCGVGRRWVGVGMREGRLECDCAGVAAKLFRHEWIRASRCALAVSKSCLILLARSRRQRQTRRSPHRL